jgi:hypothetical protein
MLRTAGLILCAIVAVEFAMSPRTFHRMREAPPEVNSPALYFAPQQDLSVVTSSRCLLFVLAPVTVEVDRHASVARINQLFRNPSLSEGVHRDL